MPLFSEQFPDIRDHILHKGKFKKKWLGTHQTYNEKKASRIKRKQEIALDEQKEKFFAWIDAIQLKLKLSNYKFAATIGIQYQTLLLWRKRSGHYPSQKSYKRLLELERQTRLSIKDLQITIRIRRK